MGMLDFDVTESRNVDQFSTEFKNIENLIEKKLYENNERIAREAVKILTEYPPVGAGNFPPAPYWSRGVGLIGGNGQVMKESYKYGNSEDRWQYRTTTGGTGIETLASTQIPYAPYLGDPQLQSTVHRDRGWKDTDTVEDAIQPFADGVLSETVNSVIAGFG